jgi:hypothetical protein
MSAPVTQADVAGYLGDAAAPADEVLPVVLAYVRSYTRGRGFDADGNPTPDLWAVCVTAAARELNIRDHGGEQREEIGTWNVFLGPTASDFTTRARRDALLPDRGDLMAKLTAAARKRLPRASFAVPKGKGSQPGKNSYPIHDASHARNALAMVAQHGTPGEKRAVKAAVKKRYPAIKVSGTKTKAAASSRGRRGR